MELPFFRLTPFPALLIRVEAAVNAQYAFAASRAVHSAAAYELNRAVQ